MSSNYVNNLYGLHGATTLAEQSVVTALVQTSGHYNEGDIAPLPMERQLVIRTVAERQRKTDFRRRVLAAYENRCAVCGLQMQLVDAAHIVPVKHSSSNDETNNGLCLCVLHHRAFDQGLIAVLPDYKIVVNRTRLTALQHQNLNGGESSFLSNLRANLSVPAEQMQRPNAALISMALNVRELQNDQLEAAPRN